MIMPENGLHQHGGSLWETKSEREEAAKSTGAEDPGPDSHSATDLVTSGKSFSSPDSIFQSIQRRADPALTSEDSKRYSRTHGYLLTSL